MARSRIYVCHSLGLKDKAAEVVAELEFQGYEVYFPARDTPQGNNVDADTILQANYEGLAGSRYGYCQKVRCCKMVVIWDGVSQGTPFDMGMAYYAGIPIEFYSVKRTWASFVKDLCDNKKDLVRKDDI